jgi:hypothetical protein
MQGGVTHPADGYPGPSEAYFRYAATSARVSQRRRWAFFNSLLRTRKTVAQLPCPVKAGPGFGLDFASGLGY